MDRDNHAGKMDAVLAYIAGFFDGEGYIGLGIQKTHGGKDRNILPTVRIVNTEPTSIEFIAKELRNRGIILWSKPRARVLKRKDGSPAQVLYEIGIAGKIQVKKFIELLMPYCLVKQAQLKVVNEFLDLRDEAMIGRGGRKGKGKAVYSEYEISLITTLKKLKH